MRNIVSIRFLISLVACLVCGGNLVVVMANNPFTVQQTYCSAFVPADPCVLTYHNDNSRDGVNAGEVDFSPTYFNNRHTPTGVLLASTDGLIYAQPLYIHHTYWAGTPSNADCPTNHYYNAVYVATENNSVYAFNADNGCLLGRINLNNGSDIVATEIALPYNDTQQGCGSVVPEVGITGTPVIDVTVTPPAMYLITTHEDVASDGTKSYRQKLHVLELDTLGEPTPALVLSSTTVSSNFVPQANMQRAGLTLVDAGGTATIWAVWGSHCDNNPYNGFAIQFSYDYVGGSWRTLTSSPIFDTTQLSSGTSCGSGLGTTACYTGIWMAGAAPAVDSSGNIYLTTANDNNYTNDGSGQYSNSILRLTSSGLADYYSPPNYQVINNPSNSNHVTIACTNPSPPSGSCLAGCVLGGITPILCQTTLTVPDWDQAV